MKSMMTPKTLSDVRKELAKIYTLASFATNRTQLEALRLMKDSLRAQIQAAAVAVSAAKFEGRDLPAHWQKFIFEK